MSPPAPREVFAAAKVNLFLHVGVRGADGYHPISSLMVFADLGDRLSLGEGGAALTIGGPFGSGLSAEADNLVIRARDALGLTEVGLILEKNLPLAAGLGAGSADAAAALRLLNPLSPRPRGDDELAEMASRLGADVAACLAGWPVIASGRGDRLDAAPRLPVLHAVLVNPGEPSPTGEVYAAFDEMARSASADRPAMPRSWATARDTAEFLAGARNDLEAPAMRKTPAIADALAALRASPETLIARMSGSGATVFALCEDEAKASALAVRLTTARPGWWVRACRLGRPWS